MKNPKYHKYLGLLGINILFIPNLTFYEITAQHSSIGLHDFGML